MASFPVSSSRESFSRDDSPDSNIGSPSAGPSKLSKFEVANYLNIVADLETNEPHDLSWQLSHPTEKHQTRYAEEHDDFNSDEGEDEFDPDLEDIDIDEEIEQPPSEYRVRRIDGPEFTPSYQDINFGDNSTTNNKKRKRVQSSKLNERNYMRWPISVKELEKTHPNTKETAIDSLEDSIKSFIHSYMRLNNLQHPSSTLSNTQRNTSNPTNDVITNSQLDTELDVELDENLPMNITDSSKELLDKVLVNLAIIRPSELGKKRKYMGNIDWNGVLGAISLENGYQPIVRRANERLRKMYKVEGHDILSRRLNILHPSNNEPEPSLLDSLYESVLPKKDVVSRPHQSQAELERRAEKRKLKQEAKLSAMSNTPAPRDTSKKAIRKNKRE